MMSGGDTYVVLVIGGAGFLGQHVVKLLQTRADHVAEIRVLDMVPYVNKLEYEARKPVRQYVGSINDLDVVRKACKGVDCVMHLASIVEVSLIPDKQFSHRINVLGTQTVIDACRTEDVRRLIYCSSTNVVLGKENIYNGTEHNTTVPKSHYYPVYGSTKAMAEDLVLRANSSQLQTVSLRPSTMYGELDVHTIKVYMNTAKTLGRYPRVSCEKGTMQIAYAGNVAWAFVCADKALHDARTDDIAGNAFFITDDTPPESLNDFLGSMFIEAGFKPFPFAIPQWLVVYPLYVLYLILSLISMIYRVNITYGIESITFLTTTFVFSYEKASRVIGYKPLFTDGEAKAKTVKYIKSIS